MADDESKGEQPIIIKKIVQGGGHHGGAWKVAYADFVTAMMAFFLLMWLLNVTDVEQKNAISDYFSPSHPVVSDSTSGAGGVMGGLSAASEGAQVSNVQSLAQPKVTGKGAQNEGEAANKNEKGTATAENEAEVITETVEVAVQDPVEAAKEDIRAEEQAELEKVQDAIEQAIAENPELAEVAENLIVDMTPEGLRIQVVDSEGNPMFPSGSARMYEKTSKLMEQVAKIVQSVPNEISVRGHTDSIPYGSGADYTNWELSSDRAHSSRRALEKGGIPANRLNNVVGKADTEHLLPDDPANARNRRISIILLREELTNPEAYQERAEKLAKARAKKATQENAPPPPASQGLPTGPAPNLGTGTDSGTGTRSTTPAVPSPQTGRFKKSDGDVTFP